MTGTSVQWIENCLNCQTQRVVISGMKSTSLKTLTKLDFYQHFCSLCWWDSLGTCQEV